MPPWQCLAPTVPVISPLLTNTVRRIPRDAQNCKIEEEYFKSSSKGCENEKGKTYEMHLDLHGGVALRVHEM
jgi:hypothetical protein